MAYTIVRDPSYSAALAKNFPKGFDADKFLSGLLWTLERNPQLGTQAAKGVWIAKVQALPIILTIYYTIDQLRNIVHLIDITYLSTPTM
jgi:hypothetical protein